MPLTKSDIFTANYQRSGAINNCIVRIDIGSTVYAFSESEMQIGDQHIYPFFISHSGVNEEFDVFTKRWTVPDITVKLANVKYRRDSSTGLMVPLINDLHNAVGSTAYIYIMAGQNVSAFSDMLAIFEGFVIESPEYNEYEIRIKFGAKWKEVERELPYDMIIDSYSGAPKDSQVKKIPIVYGKFTWAGDDTSEIDRSGNGLAVGYKINDNAVPKYIFANHICNAFTNLFIFPDGATDPCPYKDSITSDIGPTSIVLDTDDSGHTTGVGTPVVQVYGYASGENGDAQYSEYNESVENVSNIWNRDESTYCSVKDHYDDNTAIRGRVCLSYDSFIHDIIMRALEDSDILYGAYIQGKFRNFLDTGVVKRALWGVGFGIWNFTGAGSYESSPDLKTWVSYFKTWIMVEFTNANSALADGTVDNYTTGRIYSLRAKLEYKPGEMPDVAYGAIEGRVYGSWINSRSSNYESGDVIEDPSGIIESILRDICGLSSTYIDTTSFTACESPTIKSRINFHDDNIMTVFDAIQQLSEQSLFAFIFHSSGKAALIKLTTAGSTSRIINYSWLKENTLKLHKSSHLINKIRLWSRWHEELGEYIDFATVENTTSQTNYGRTNTYNARWPNINGPVATLVANHYVRKADGGSTDDDGLWASQHIIIKFETVGIINVDLQIGDWIECDAESFDSRLLCYGMSWSGLKFLVTSIKKDLTSTKIEAIKLF
jgi:hypothetical protein